MSDVTLSTGKWTWTLPLETIQNAVNTTIPITSGITISPKISPKIDKVIYNLPKEYLYIGGAIIIIIAISFITRK